MKTSLRILGLLLLGLFAISMVGCQRTDDPVDPPLSHEEKLAGEYELVRAERNEEGVIEGYEPPAVKGSMILIYEGPVYTSFTDVDGYEENQKSDAWTATATTLIYDEWFLSYTLEGDILTLTEDDDDFIQTYTFKKVS